MDDFSLHVPQAELDDLHARLDATRWPAALPGDEDWSLGVPLDELRELAQAWRDLDWRAVEAELNAFDQLTTTIDGTTVHALHVRSPEPDALPLVISHGWPGSVVELLDVLGPLTDPASYGGDPRDAFTVVAPSLPGYGLSGPTPDAGWSVERMADAFDELVRSLGHERYGAQGGDWGSHVSRALGRRHPDRVVGVHVTMLTTEPPQGAGADDRTVASAERYRTDLSGYNRVQAQRPASLMYAFTDSPVGLLAWVAERFHDWTDPATPVPRERLLADVALYWFSRTTGSAARLYHETYGGAGRDAGRSGGAGDPAAVPLGVAVFPHDLFLPSRERAEQAHRVEHWTEMPRGGHFAALEVPDLLVEDVRAFFRPLR